ncbi:MAG: DNA repair protein RadC [Acidobacteria bacterium]|nr:DNA repair protein RadC [Acidobacteriota bacterium]
MDYATLSDQELITLLIGRQAAARLRERSLGQMLSEAEKDVRTYGKLLAAREIVRRALREDLNCQPGLSSPTAVRDYLRLHFIGKEHEAFVALFLDSQHHVIEIEELFRGTLSQTSVYPREVVKQALKHNAAAAVFAHNHPSGVAEPSSADELLTRTLKQSLALVDISVLDHFVVAGTKAISFAERGLI